jgi:coproporphyrinogen III oxidase-like Fe-S oxidoreductase
VIAERMAPLMIKRGLKGTGFSRIVPSFPSNMDNIGWYIHLPFCRRLCPYCSFRSLQYSPGKVRPYVEAVKKEVLTYHDRLGKINISDVYFGGGTPSLTWEAAIEITEHIRSQFKMAGEVGLEASPEDINETICDSLMRAGITRISLGVQSFDDKILGTMRRGYDAKTVHKAIELLLGRGFFLSVDLLYGLPRQRTAGLLTDLETITGTGVHQISHYPLMLFPYTRWYHDAQKGSITMPSPRLEKEMFYAISDFLTANGYQQTSCWDFTSRAKTGTPYATCTRDENIGVGLSAYTKIGGLFYVNTFSLKEYIKGVEDGLPVATGMITPRNRVMRRWFMMGLYRLKVEKAEFEKLFGVEMNRAMGRFLLMLKLLGIIKEHPGHIQVTRRGMYWASLMTKTSMLTFPARYYQECLHHPWPGDFEM